MPLLPAWPRGLLPPQRSVSVSESVLALRFVSCPIFLISSAVCSFSLAWGAGQKEQKMSFPWLVGPSSVFLRGWPLPSPAVATRGVCAPLSCHC